MVVAYGSIIGIVNTPMAGVSATINILLVAVLARADNDDHIAKVMLSMTVCDFGAGTLVPVVSAIFAWVEPAMDFTCSSEAFSTFVCARLFGICLSCRP